MDAQEGWTVHVIWVDKQQGAKNGMRVEERYAVPLPQCGDTSLEDFMKAVNAVKKKIRSDLTVMDLSPFDESVLGYQTSLNRSLPDPNFVSKWVPTVSNPKPVNCTWTPDRTNPAQRIADAGLCNGAELTFVKVSCWRG